MAKFTGQKPDFENQCEAAARSGNRCKRPCAIGGNVCRFHGGAAPQVLEANRIRLAALVSPAIGKLAQALKAQKNDRHIPFNLQLSAAKTSLDLNGYKSKDEIVVTQSFDTARFANMSDEEIAQFVKLGRKLTVAKDAREEVGEEVDAD